MAVKNDFGVMGLCFGFPGRDLVLRLRIRLQNLREEADVSDRQAQRVHLKAGSRV